MNCTKCKQPLDEKATYCPSCGTKTNHNKGLKKRIFLGFLMVLGVLTTFAVALVVYSHHSEYNLSFSILDDKVYFEHHNFSHISRYENGTIQYHIPTELFNTLLNKQMSLIDNSKAIVLNTADKKLYLNCTMHGLNVPLSCPVKFQVKKRSISLDLSDFDLGNRHIPVIKPLESLLCNAIRSYPLELTSKDFNVPDLFIIEQVSLNDNTVILELQIQEQKMEKLIKTIQTSKNGAILNIYKRSEQASNEKALEILQSESLSDKQTQLLLEDLANDQILLYQLLVASDKDALDTLFNDYEALLSGLSQQDIESCQNQLIEQYISIDFKPILDALEQELNKNDYYVFNNKPYNRIDKTYITLDNLIETYQLNLNIDKNNLQLFYNQGEAAFNIAYRLPEATYILISNDDYSVLTEAAFIEMSEVEENGNARYVFEPQPDVEKPIMGFYDAEEIFIRYMKADKKYAFVIASPDNDYQRYTSFAIKNYGDCWRIIETDIRDLNAFNKENPDFNINTATKLHLTSPEILSDEEMAVILKDLDYRGLESESDVTIKYCSYSNNYVAVKLSNDHEYLYRMDYGYLDSVYRRADIPSWWDVPELILLQY